MVNQCVPKNILVLGVESRFGEFVVEGLATEGNTLLLCGDCDERQRNLINRLPNHVKGVSSTRSSEHYKQLHAMIESQGSLDAVIFLMECGDSRPFLMQSHQEIYEIFDSTLVRPICILKEIYPYLRKASDCTVVFVETGVYEDQAGSSAHVASHYGLWGFCEAMKCDFRAKGIDVRSISTPSIRYESDGSLAASSSSKTHQQYLKVVSSISDAIRTAGDMTLPVAGFDNPAWLHSR